MNKKFLIGTLCAASILSPAAAFAASAVPQPGESLPPAPESRPDIETNLPDTPGSPNSVFRFTLNKIKVEQSETKCSQKKLEAIAQKATGHEITVEDLDRTLSELSAYCRNHGYPAAYAYVPDQKAKGGVLTVVIGPGRFGKIKVENEAGVWDGHRAEGLVAGLKPGDVIRSRTLESALFNINELHGVAAAGALTPGEEEGTSDLTVRVKQGKDWSATVYTENYGSRSSGRYRYGLQASLMDLTCLGGRFTVGGLLSNSNLHNYNVGWDMPVGHSGTNLGIRYSRMDYELGSIFSEIGANGIANTLSFFGQTPLWRTAGSAMVVTYGFDHRQLTDELRSMGIKIKKRSNSAFLGLDGMVRNGTQTAVHYNLTGHTGKVEPTSEWGSILGEEAGTLGSFNKLTLDLVGMQQMGKDFDVLLKFSGQKANKNLDSSEQLYLGGAHGVRAYPQGEGAGDEGCIFTAEVRYHTPIQGLIFSSYFDIGHVRRAKDGSLGDETLRGWGLGLTYQHPSNYFARLDYARRIGAPSILSNDAQSRQRIWFMAGKTF